MAFLPWLRFVGLSEDVSLDFPSAIFGDTTSDLAQAKIWLILWILWICTNMLFIYVAFVTQVQWLITTPKIP